MLRNNIGSSDDFDDHEGDEEQIEEDSNDGAALIGR